MKTFEPFACLYLTLGLALGFVSEATGASFPIANNAKLRDHAHPSVAFDGRNYLVGLQVPNAGDTVSQVAAQLIGPDGGSIGLPLLVADSGDATVVTFDGAKYLVGWSQGTTVNGQFVSVAGERIGGVFSIGTLAVTGGSSGLRSLSFDGANFLALWRDGNNDLYVRLVSTAGTPVGTALKVNATGAGPAEVAFDGTNYLVVWTSETTIGLFGRFVTREGAHGGAVFTIDPDDVGGRRIYFDGARYVVAFVGRAPLEDVHARFVSTSGVVGDRIPIASGASGQRFPTMAFDGANYLFVWTDRVTATDVTLKGRYFNADGAPASAEFTLLGPQGVKLPRFAHLIYDGQRYLAVAELQGTPSDLVGIFIPRSQAQPSLSSAGLAAGQFRMTLSGTPGMTYLIVSSNAVPFAQDNTLVATVTLTFPTFSAEVQDSSPPAARRFYRAVKR